RRRRWGLPASRATSGLACSNRPADVSAIFAQFAEMASARNFANSANSADRLRRASGGDGEPTDWPCIQSRTRPAPNFSNIANSADRFRTEKGKGGAPLQRLPSPIQGDRAPGPGTEFCELCELCEQVSRRAIQWSGSPGFPEGDIGASNRRTSLAHRRAGRSL